MLFINKEGVLCISRAESEWVLSAIE